MTYFLIFLFALGLMLVPGNYYSRQLSVIDRFFLAFTIKFCLNKFTGPTPVERCECVAGFFYIKHELKKQATPVYFIDLPQALRLTDLGKMFRQF